MTTPLALMPTTPEALRAEIDRLRTQLAEYVGHEPTFREEMQHLSDENDRLRQLIKFLVYDALDRPSITIQQADIDYYLTGHLDIEPDPIQPNATRITFRRRAGR